MFYKRKGVIIARVKKNKNGIISKLRLKLMELRYLPHLEVRLVHDKTYQRSGTYKKWTDSKYSSTVHKTVLFSFLLSFIVFQGLQSLYPYLNLFEPREVRSATNSFTWDSDTHFSEANTTDITIDGTGDSAVARISDSSFQPQGDGTDGALVVSSEFNINTDTNGNGGRTAADGVIWTVDASIASSQDTVTSSVSVPTGFAAGDEVMVVNLKGTTTDYSNVGIYEFADVQTVNANSIVLSSNLTNAYDGTTQKIIVQRIPNYTDVTISSSQTLTASAWNGSSGGLLAFRASGVLVNNGTIDMTGKGYRGGAPATSSLDYAYGGESYNGTGGRGGNSSINGTSGQGGGGGGGTQEGGVGTGAAGLLGSAGGGGGSVKYNSGNASCKVSTSGGGGGGGYGSIGEGGSNGGNGSGSNGGAGANGVSSGLNSLYTQTAGGGGGGGTVGSSSTLDIRAYFGGAGAGAGKSHHDNCSQSGTKAGGPGGDSGGIIIIGTNNIVNDGQIVSQGEVGGAGYYSTYNKSGGGGGGAGGSIVISAKNFTNNSIVSATGGAGGDSGGILGPGGGDGGGGRTYLEYGSKSGSNPSPNVSINASQPYLTSGTVGASNTGLRFGNPSLETNYGWSSIDWSGTGITSTYKLKVQARAGDSWGSGDTGYINPVTGDSSWYEITSNSGTDVALHSSLTSTATKTIEFRLELVGDGGSTPQLDSLTIDYNSLEVPPQSGLYLRKSDGTTPFRTYYGSEVLNGTYGGHAFTNETSARIRATSLSCTGCGTSENIRPEVEVSTMTDTDFSSPVFTGTSEVGDDYVDITGLEDGEDYQMRVRAIDDQGRVSAWTNYAGDYEAGDPDFSVDQSAPSGTVSINSGDTYANSTNVTLNLTASDTGGSSFGDNEAWLDMQFSNDGTNWSDWEDFAYTKAWTLDSGDGEKNVYVQFIDNAGNISGSGEWTSQPDWETATGNQIDTTSQAGDLLLASSGAIDYGDGSDGDYILSTSKTIKEIYETDLGYGAGTYNPGTGAVPNFNDLTIQSGGVITTSNLVEINFKVSNNFTIQSGGSINADGLGYTQASGPGAGVSGGRASGAGYGGNGGAAATGSPAGGSTYPYTTSHFGSGGGGGNGTGGSGGGAINISVSSITNSGVITANGNAAEGAATGGGSGGSIYITTNSSTLSGTLQVNGGNGGNTNSMNLAGGGGGGGRIYIKKSSSSPVSGSLEGGAKGTGGIDGYPGEANPEGVVIVLPYMYSGTLGETGTALSYDAGSDRKWMNLSWGADTLASGQAIKYQISTDGTNWKGPDGNAGNWTDNFFGQVEGQSAITDIPSNFPISQTIYVKVRMEGDGSSTPVLNNLSATGLVLNTITLDATTPTVSSYSIETDTGDQVYAIEGDRLITAKGIFYDSGNTDDLEVQLSEDGTNWGKYSGSGTTNSTTTDWTNYITVTPHQTNVQNLVSAWYIEDPDEIKTIYVRARDAAGNIVGGSDQFADNYIDGGVGTALEGKQVYNQDLQSPPYFWKTSDTFCVGPQCSSGVLVSPQANPEVDFSEYPAQNACKNIGGRLPTLSELDAMYAQRNNFGASFLTAWWYWTSEEANETDARDVWFIDGRDASHRKSGGLAQYARCVRDVSDIAEVISDNITLDTANPSNVSGLTASQNNPDNINVSWTGYDDGAAPATNYQIERVKRIEYDGIIDDPVGVWSGAASYSVIDCGATTSFVDGSGGVSGCTLTSGVNITQSTAYYYRVRARDAAHPAAWGVWNGSAVMGLTTDNDTPGVVTNVSAVPCDGVSNCSAPGNKGYEVKLTWDPSTDDGSGVTGYKIFRALSDSTDEDDFELVGYLDVNPAGSPATTEWYDNDTNNDATFTDATTGDVKTSSSDRLNDYVEYFYRITAVDESGNGTDIVPYTGVPPVASYANRGNATTPDVTNPDAPTGLSVTPFGIDGTNPEPDNQQLDISWTASSDTRTNGRTPTGTGSGIATYTLEWATGDDVGPISGWTPLNPISSPTTTYEHEGLSQDTYYYYRVKATDNASLTSSYSAVVGVQTKNSAVPTTPTNVTVTSKKGDPNSDSEVGDRIDISFGGSAIKFESNSITDYELYRSETNLATEGEWLASTLVHTFTNVNHSGYADGGQPVYHAGDSYTDTSLDDSKTYYYRVRAKGNNTTSGIVYSSLSAVQTGTLNAGWDTTPDATAPESPQEVKVKDIHSNSNLYRNIVTWAMITDPQREGSSDFSHYEVWRYETSQGIGTASKISTDLSYEDRGNNYLVDGIVNAEADKDYSYYVVAIDNADTEYKYASPNNDTVINAVANRSNNSASVSINPFVAQPTVSNVAHSNVGVSSATISWDTNQDTDSQVEYRVKDSSDVLTSGKNRVSMTQDHEVTLKALEKNKTYQYRIISENSLGNKDTSEATAWVHEFATADFSITNIEVETTTTTATITWKTNVNADSSVEYKRENSSEQSKSSGDPVQTKTHSVVVEALRPATTYTYKIRSVTSDNYVADTNFATFSTKAYDADQFVINPSASEIAEENITATSAKIVWNTAIATTTWVDYGTESGSYGQSAGNNDYNTVHVVELKNLTPGQKYYYRVRGTDTNDIEYTSKEYSFTAVLKPTITVAKVENVTSYTADIVFTTNVDTEASVMYGNSEAFGLQAGTAELKRNHVINLKDLEDATTYYYYIEIRDKIGNNYKTDVATFATPIDKEGAKVENLKIDILPMGESDETASVIISWNTNKPTTTKVEYDEGVISNKLGQSTIEDESLNNSHTVIIKELNPSTTYKFKIAGKDKRGNNTESQDYTFVTPEKEKSIWQLILRSIEETFSWTQNIGSFFRRGN